MAFFYVKPQKYGRIIGEDGNGAVRMPFRRRDERLNPPSANSSWHKEQSHHDTIVFVHGILGSHDRTWGQFHELLSSDKDLPNLDILSWGYRTGLAPSSYADVETEGKVLISALETLVRSDRHIYLVGHSMGGLVILKGLVERIRFIQGKTHPVTAVKGIWLYASPVHGSQVANVVAVGLVSWKWLRWASRLIAYRQLNDLRRGKFCDELIRDVNDMIYRPTADNPLTNGPIRIRACVAIHDPIVSLQSAGGIFSDPPPLHLDANHSSIKLPDHHGDARYLALKSDLERHLADSFSALCRSLLREPERAVRQEAAERLDQQYGAMIRRCTIDCFKPREVTDDDVLEVATCVYEAGCRGGGTPAQIMTQVYRDYRFRNDPRFQ